MQYLIMLLPQMLRWFVGFAIAKAFISLAVGIVSYSIIQFIFDKYINAALSQIAYMGDVAAIIAIAQLDHAISIVIGALTIKGFLMAAKITLGARQG